MSIGSLFRELLRQDFLGVPKTTYRFTRLEEIIGEVSGETCDDWLVRCVHAPGPPAPDATIANVAQQLGLELPPELHLLLTLSDGGQFYKVPLIWHRDSIPAAEHVRYHLFSTDELIDVNQDLVQRFRHTLGGDPDFCELDVLNYIAFCDAHNGDYLAVLLEGPEVGKVFFLHHGYSYRPYSDQDADLYHHVASSLEGWLDLIVRTKGWNGFGEDVPGL